MSMEERVSRTQDKISKLNIVIFKRLKQRRALKAKILDLKDLEDTQFKMTVRREKPIKTGPSVV